MPDSLFDHDDAVDASEDTQVTADPALVAEYAGTEADEPTVSDSEAAEEAAVVASKSDSEGETEAEQAALVKPDPEQVAEQPVVEVSHFLVRDPDFYPDHDEIAVAFPGSGLEDVADEYGRIVLSGEDGIQVSPEAARNADGVAGVIVHVDVSEVSA